MSEHPLRERLLSRSDARALSRRAPGRRAGRLPDGAPTARRRARPRTRAASCTSSSGGSSSTIRSLEAPRRLSSAAQVAQPSPDRVGACARARSRRGRARCSARARRTDSPALTAGASGIVAVRTGVGPGRGGDAAGRAAVGGHHRRQARSGWRTPATGRSRGSIRTSGVVVDRIPVGGDPASITSGDGAIWVASTRRRDDPDGSIRRRETRDPDDRARRRQPGRARVRRRAAVGSGLVDPDALRDRPERPELCLRTIPLDRAATRNRLRRGRALGRRLQQRDAV